MPVQQIFVDRVGYTGEVLVRLRATAPQIVHARSVETALRENLATLTNY